MGLQDWSHRVAGLVAWGSRSHLWLAVERVTLCRVVTGQVPVAQVPRRFGRRFSGSHLRGFSRLSGA